MKILGLNFGELNSSAAIVKNGRVFAGSGEERFTRKKKTKDFPKKSIDFCLETINTNLAKINAVAQSWNPGVKWVNYNPKISSKRIKREDYFYSLPDNLFSYLDRKRIPDYVKQEIPGAMPDIYYIKHHLCHASNAFFLSNFQNAAFLTADWQGELECIIRGFGKGNKLTILDTQWMPHSIGMYYATYTQLLGYRPDNDEWKVMALSAANIDARTYEKKIMKTIKFCGDGKFELDLSYYKGSLQDQPYLYSDKLLKLLDAKSNKDKILKNFNWQCKIAKAMQTVAEKVTWYILDDLYKKTKKDNLVLSGGFFMNSVINGKILKNTKFKNVYVSHSPDDLGNSIGAALYVYHCIFNKSRVTPNSSSSIGPSFTNSNIENSLKRREIKYEKLANPYKTAAKILANKDILAIFQGKMEFGDRALGYRSIIADPRDNNMKDKINNMIKYRENYRPFAPAALKEKATEFFEVEKDYKCCYMEKVIKVKKKWRKELPAITHFDGSGRLQTVDMRENPYFYKIIIEFEKLTNIPIVLNTSFNVNGEPIVLSPDDALNTFFNSGLKYLIMSNFLIKK